MRASSSRISLASSDAPPVFGIGGLSGVRITLLLAFAAVDRGRPQKSGLFSAPSVGESIKRSSVFACTS